MREFFITWFERIVGLLIIAVSLGFLVAGFGTMAGLTGQPGGVFAGIMILIAGAIYVVLMGGVLYLGLGIYQNTKRMADALERRTD